MKITQKGLKIISDFTELENQYSNETIEIPVEFSDSEFNGYEMFASIEIKTFATYNHIIPLVDRNKIVLPDLATAYSGVLTISLFGAKGNLRKTTNKVTLNVVESNPTDRIVKPTSQDWVQLMEEMVTLTLMRYASKVAPSIDDTTKHWKMGQTLTPYKAVGDKVTINATTKRWEIDGVDTGVIAEGHTDLRPATKGILGGVIAGNTLKVSSNGTLDVDRVVKTITLNRTNWNSNKVYTISDSLITATSIQSILPVQLNNPPTTQEVEYMKTLTKMNLAVVGQGTGYINICCLGTLPTGDINIQVIFEK